MCSKPHIARVGSAQAAVPDMSASDRGGESGYGRWLEIFVPGRICLMGEHSDWAGSYRRFNRDIVPGMCLVSGTNQGMYARVRPHPHKLIVSSVDHFGNKYGPTELLMDPEVLLKAAAAGYSYFSYIYGVAYQIAVRYNCRGLVIENYKTDLPQAKGLSSSAAATVLAARAFNRVYDLKLSVRGEMDLAYHGEITTPSQCGRMDQCCAFGARPVLMKFDGDLLECEELTLGAPLYIVIVELAGSKDTTTILQRLNKCFPVADDEEQAGLQDLLGATVRRSPAQTRAGQFDADSATTLTRPGAGRDRTSGSSRRASRRSPRATCRSWASS